MESRKGKTLVKGHTLFNEGELFYELGKLNRSGNGECSCGAISEVLPSTAARQRWHREHKAEVVARGKPHGEPDLFL